MRGGSIPVLAWATLLLVLFVGNWITDNHGVNPIEAGVASAIVYATALAFWLMSREAIHRGPPEAHVETETVPQASLAAVLAGLAVGCILFGLAWANFLMYFGAGLLVLSLGRLVVEVRAERAMRSRLSAEEQRR